MCGTDYLCSAGIQCTSCLQGYSLVSGQCISQSSCQLYSYYQKGNSSSAWSPSNCVCLPGYYLSSVLNCSPCDISCLTCNGTSSSNCLTCPEGYLLSAWTCSKATSGSQVKENLQWTSALGFNASINSNNQSDLHDCGTYRTLFGYMSPFLTNTSTFIFNTSVLAAADYYGISFRLQVLFIDNWDTSAGLFFILNSDLNPSFIYRYNNYGAIGEQQCGTNLNDYLMLI